MLIKTLGCANRTHLASLHLLQIRAYRVEAELIGHWALPPLKETLGHLRLSPETVLGTWEGTRLVRSHHLRGPGRPP